VALVAVRAVVDVPGNAAMIPVRLASRMAHGALEHGVVVGIRMARRANSLRVAVSHRKPGVIKRRTSPRCRRVAGLASGRESSRLMVRVGGPGVVLGMAGIAVGRRSCELPADVATGARHSDVRTRQGKWCFRMIENCSSP